MITGHLREKNNYYHIILNYIDSDGISHSSSKSTGLPVRGNKKRAEDKLREAKDNMENQLLEQKEVKQKAF